MIARLPRRVGLSTSLLTLTRVRGVARDTPLGRRHFSVCWSCGHEDKTETHGGYSYFCNNCGRIQSPPSNIESHFKVLGLPARFDLSPKDLNGRLLEYQKKLHPDRFSQATHLEKEYSESISSLINASFDILQSPVLRAQHLMILYTGDDPLAEETSSQDIELLMEILETREAVDSLRNDSVEEGERILKHNEECAEECVEELLELFNRMDVSGGRDADTLQRLSGQIVRLQYLDKIRTEIIEKVEDV